MSGPAGLEWRYRRLLAWYPRSFRREQEDEMLAVLMAGARWHRYAMANDPAVPPADLDWPR
jgi:hypothetical protein